MDALFSLAMASFLPALAESGEIFFPGENVDAIREAAFHKSIGGGRVAVLPGIEPLTKESRGLAVFRSGAGDFGF